MRGDCTPTGGASKIQPSTTLKLMTAVTSKIPGQCGTAADLPDSNRAAWEGDCALTNFMTIAVQ